MKHFPAICDMTYPTEGEIDVLEWEGIRLDERGTRHLHFKQWNDEPVWRFMTFSVTSRENEVAQVC